LGRRLEAHPRLGSTQDEARRLARQGAPEGTVVWALEQTAGRGRLDRAWSSPRGCGLWFSVVLRPRCAPEAAGFVGIVAGVAMAEALGADGGPEVRLKWPNDLRLRGRKLGGLLAEAEVAGGELRHVVLGAGVNVVEPPGGFPPELAELAIALGPARPAGAGEAEGLGDRLAALLVALEAGIDRWRVEGPEPARAAWKRLSETLGREVRAEVAGGAVAGRAVDLLPDGALLLELADGSHREVRSGEVSHLR
jgi:BirA family biotin operon repressor/biotin-[acetyl-CoA-carboxylase] ligase